MSLTLKEPDVEQLLRYGLLPENLPPAINSGQLWDTFLPEQGSYLITQKARGSHSPFSASKRGGQRRLFGLPHPSFVHDAATFMEKNWAEIVPVLDQATGYLSKPKFAVAGPRAVRITPHSELPKARLRAFSRFRFCAVTDVSRCYPSIYTHSIPWAINGRAKAKADQKHTSGDVFGNRLDFIMRQAQDGQTIGIAVGPDVSRLTGEIILSAVDGVFLSKYGKQKPTYLRHVDDYWIGGDSVEECELHLQNLRASLRSFELDLNDLKTKIIPTNKTLGESWPVEFERELKLSLTHNWRGSNYDAVSTLSKIVDKATSESDDGMIRHAIRKIDENNLWDEEWEVLEHFLAQCAVQFPHSFDYVARVIAWRIRIDSPVDLNLWQHVAVNAVGQAASLGRDAEALWGLWLLSELKLFVSKTLSDTLIKNCSPLVLSYLAHMFSRGRTRDKTLGALLWSRVEGNPYSGTGWPLSLELVHLGIGGFDFAPFEGTERGLTLLHKDGLSIVDWSALPKVFFDDDGDPIAKPRRAIEDFTSDYDADDEDDDDGFSAEIDW